ncbi:hypothetical protein [Niabella sp.]|uniref:hypothetical protein n=1 Tax=Niabella sp. TaxID=1962976 RepID=UPI00261EE613|nr:hypothetical protein [Niabella sp.]
MRKLLICFGVALLFCSCMKGESVRNDLNSAFVKAMTNRSELEKVLKKYSAQKRDSLKRKAAIFLIQNMPGYFSYEGKGIEEFCNYFRALKSSIQDPAEVLDSISHVYGNFVLKENRKKYDIVSIDSAYLCENIELAFKAWQEYPWARKYSFEDFCEYILPYRIGNEKLTNWRLIFFKEYSSILNGIKTENPIEVANILRDSIISRQGAPRFTMIRPSNYPTLDALTSKYAAGACGDLVQFTISLFRTFGIAACEDIMPIRGDANVGHSWVSLFNNEHELYNVDFFGPITYVSETMINRLSAKPKVYRRTYSLTENKLRSQKGFVPLILAEMLDRSIDVTKMYANNLDDLVLQKSKLYKTEVAPSIVFLCAPSWLNWVPVTWSLPDENGNVKFNDIDGGSILRVAYFDKGEVEFLSDPFYVNRQTKKLVFMNTNELSPSNEIKLFSKFMLNREILYRDRLVGGVFEGANNRGFINPDTLFTIESRPFRLFTDAYISASKRYRFLRYKGPINSYCNIAEIEFYSKKTKLTGKVIGSAGSQKDNPKYEYSAAFDGLTETSFDHSTPSEGWVGVSLRHPARITHIRYVPRNYDNYIKPGNDYELFICQKGGWTSLGIKTASSDSLVYKMVSENALLYLKNHTGGQEERIFLMKNGLQLFK